MANAQPEKLPSPRPLFEDAIRRDEESFRLLVESVSDYAIYMLDTEGRVISWNTGAQRLKGWTDEEILGRSVAVFHPAESVAQGRPQEELRIARDEGVFREEARRVRKDGTEFIADVTLTALYDETHRLRGYAKVTRDITDRRLAEDALRDSEEKFRLLVDSVQDYAIFLLDADGRVASWNAGAQRMNGWRADEIIGRPVATFHPPDVVVLGRPADELRLAREQGVFREEARRVRKDGSEFYADVTLTALYGKAGTLRGIAKITRDITERKRVEQRVEMQTRALQAANRELQSFAYSVAHDLRAPLRAMRGFSQILVEDYAANLDETGQDFLRRIASAAERMDELIADLLGYARLGHEDVPLSPVSLNLVASVVEDQAAVLLTESKGSIVVERPLPVVKGNLTALIQVLSNLVSNGLKFVEPETKPVVRIWAEPRGSHVRVWVEDNGIGVSPEHHARIFEVFQRLHGVVQYEGTGIGLAAVRKGMERMGGTVGLESDLGKGSRFWFELLKAD
jgi:PAS domain S-box-containing protein